MTNRKPLHFLPVRDLDAERPAFARLSHPTDVAGEAANEHAKHEVKWKPRLKKRKQGQGQGEVNYEEQIALDAIFQEQSVGTASITILDQSLGKNLVALGFHNGESVRCANSGKLPDASQSSEVVINFASWTDVAFEITLTR